MVPDLIFVGPHEYEFDAKLIWLVFTFAFCLLDWHSSIWQQLISIDVFFFSRKYTCIQEWNIYFRKHCLSDFGEDMYKPGKLKNSHLDRSLWKLGKHKAEDGWWKRTSCSVNFRGSGTRFQQISGTLKTSRSGCRKRFIKRAIKSPPILPPKWGAEQKRFSSSNIQHLPCYTIILLNSSQHHLPALISQSPGLYQKHVSWPNSSRLIYFIFCSYYTPTPAEVRLTLATTSITAFLLTFWWIF